MEKISVKVHLRPAMPTEEDPVSDEKRVRQTLEAMGYEPVHIPLAVLRRLYPLCRSGGVDITVTLVYRGQDWAMTNVEPGDTTAGHYGLALDYGSTTMIMQMVDLNSGAVVGEEKAVNAQTAFGTDILSRITYAAEAAEHADDLQHAAVQTMEELLDRLTEHTGIQAAKCPVMVVSGNTTMIHFLLKLDAWPVFASPYAPVTSDPGFFWGRELDLDFDGLLYIVPSASNYVGGDIISGLLASQLHRQEEPGMFFDIGTNGELVMGNRDWLLAGAGAAGPALEGYISRFGIRAAPGAVDSVRIHRDQLSFTTIENRSPIGICGSGIIDLLAGMRLNGWINVAGELNPDASQRIREMDGEYAAVYASEEESATGQPLYFTQTDILQYLDTKAAAATMVECLLETAGIRAEELGRCWLSGAFPAHSDLESAIVIGIFPDLPREKYTLMSNSSLEGARMLLLDRTLMAEAADLADSIYCVQFASIPDFLVRMQAAKFIPHTDMTRYPTVLKMLQH